MDTLSNILASEEPLSAKIRARALWLVENCKNSCNEEKTDKDGDRNFEGLKKFVLEKANAKAKVESREAEGKVEL